MDSNSSSINDRHSTSKNVNGSARRSSPVNSPTACGSPGTPTAASRPVSLMDSPGAQSHIVHVVVNRDEKGYGMKVSGDNPVYVQSVKDGGPAARGGLHAGDKIIKVNGVNVTSCGHTEVVELIKASSHVVLTVQQRARNPRAMGSPSLHNRPMTTLTHSNSIITGPQPVDNEKQYQLQLEREQHYRLMIEKEQRYVDLLRGQLAQSPDEKKYAELAKTERNLQTLQAMLQNHVRSQNEQTPFTPNTDTPPPLPNVPPPATDTNLETPPPLPQRNRSGNKTNKNSTYVNGGVLPSTIVGIDRDRKPARVAPLVSDSDPPPIPPRQPLNSGSDAVNSLSKQMKYPLVTNCPTLVNNCSPPHTHKRTKSTPESFKLCTNMKEASNEFIRSESEAQKEWPDGVPPPPGTPPPPYPSPLPPRRQIYNNRSSSNTDFTDTHHDEMFSRVVANSSPIHAANPQTPQPPIISMEDDEISDQEIGQMENHGPFKTLSQLREHPPHLAVFTNYVLLNCDPNSLLFYLITDLYKQGNAKDMRRWAFEIHSCFLVPGGPLHLCNVDENIAREIDDVLAREVEGRGEEILRKVFWKARNRAKETLTKQLAEFQQKRTAGMGTIYGPNDSVLVESSTDKVKETKLLENLFSNKVEPYLDELEKESHDPKRYYTAAALTTVITRVFSLRPTGHGLDRFPTFLNKKSIRTKLIKYSKKLSVQGHQFVDHMYYTVYMCNNCHQIIYGIGPQGYQCSVCLINLHRQCVKLYEDVCPGPINKKLPWIPHKNDPRKKPTEKESKRHSEEGPESEGGDAKPGHPVSRTGSDRRPDAVREEASKTQEGPDHGNDKREEDVTNTESTVSLPASTGGNKRRTVTNINRSESVKEQSEKEKRKQRRNISDPLHNTTTLKQDTRVSPTKFYITSTKDQIELDSQGIGTNSGSSSNSSLSSNSRFSECLSNNSSDAALGSHATAPEWDSDMEVEVDPPDWQRLVPPEDLASLHPCEKKRQDVINELFHTEKSHVRNLKVLDIVFMKPLTSKQCLKQEELNLVFPNLNELLELHVKFNNTMKNKRKETPVIRDLGDILLAMFDGPVGETFQRASATFCQRQQLALELIKEKRRKDSRFETILTDCEKHNLCRRLPLQGIIPTQMQRLSKYPLFLERLITTVEESVDQDPDDYWQSELIKLKQAYDRCKEILNHVNEAAKTAYNRARLEEIQRHLDASSEYKNFDLTKDSLIHEGDMLMQRPNKGPLAIYTVLTKTAVVFLQKEGDRFLLKPIATGAPGQKPLAPPVITMNTLLFRKNAGKNNILYIVNTTSDNVQMSVLHVRDYTEREVWLKHLLEATDAYKEGKSKSTDSAQEPEEETVQDLPPSNPEPTERAESVEPASEVVEDSERTATTPTPEDTHEEDATLEGENTESPADIGSGVVTKLTTDDWPLIEPSELQVVVPPVLTAESRVTSLEQIRRKDEAVRQALADKESLVADLLSIPREDFHHIADMAGEEVHRNDAVASSAERDLTEFVLAPMYQVNRLLKAVNESLNISEADGVHVTGGDLPSCASNTCNKSDHLPAVPAHKLRDIVSVLSSQLTTLLSVVKQGDVERDRLRKEVYQLREQVHERSLLHGHQTTEGDSVTTLDSLQSGDLESIEECPTENES